MASKRRRHKKHLVVLAFLGIQLGLPSSYYPGDDIYDERFAWRMFSPIRMVKCDVAFAETANMERPISLKREIGLPWINWMKRGHRRVMEGYAAHYCEAAEAEGATASLHSQVSCRLPDGEVDHLYSPQEDLCEAR